MAHCYIVLASFYHPLDLLTFSRAPLPSSRHRLGSAEAWFLPHEVPPLRLHRRRPGRRDDGVFFIGFALAVLP